jgi:hypothetical protein
VSVLVQAIAIGLLLALVCAATNALATGVVASSVFVLGWASRDAEIQDA